jgi:hypothetical protein
MVGFSRQIVVAGIFLALMGWLTRPVFGADAIWPSPVWTTADDPAAFGWSLEKLAKDEAYTQAYARARS